MGIEDGDLRRFQSVLERSLQNGLAQCKISFSRKMECDYSLEFSRTYWVNFNVVSDFDSNLATTLPQWYRDIDTEEKRESRAGRRNKMETLPLGAERN